MDQYSAYDALKKELVESVGFAGKQEIPGTLVRKIAEFLDEYPDDSMTTYYASSLLDQFYRRRTKERSVRLFDSLSSFLKNKSPLIDLFLRRPFWQRYPTGPEQHFDAATIWSAICDLDDGYDKANCIVDYACLFNDEVARVAYHTILEIPDPYKTRALAGIYSKVDALRKAEIVAYMLQRFGSGVSESAYHLKFMFPYMDDVARTQVVAAHLDLPDVPEAFIAYLIIRNAAYFAHDDAIRLAARTRTFELDYYRNRCLLKLAAYLHEGEVEKLYEQFMKDFNALPACSALIHNLYHFSSVMKTLDTSHVVSLALEKIDCLADPPDDYFKQAKYGEMMFLMPLLTDVHRERAFRIAETIRGGYKKSLKSKLKAHFAQSKNYCEIRYSPICY